jgi:hypothetical protein
MGIEVLTDHAHPRGFGRVDRKQVAALMGPVPSGPGRGHLHRPRARERLRAQEDLRRPLAFRLVVPLRRRPWGSGKRPPGLCEERDGWLVPTAQGIWGLSGR